MSISSFSHKSMRTVSIAGREAYLLEALNLAILAIQALPESKRSFYQEDKALFEVWFWETARLLQQSKAN